MDSQSWSSNESNAREAKEDVFDYKKKQDELESKGIACIDDWILRLTVAIEHSHCEVSV